MPLLKHSNVLKIQDIFLTRIKLINFPTLCKRSFASHWDDFVPLEWVISRILSPFRGGDHPSRENRYRFPQATYPRISCGRHNPPIWSCSGWGLPDRPVTRSVGELLPHHFTLTPQTRGGMFLWHFPWGHPHWVLPSTLPSGVRTFLRQRNVTGDRLTHSVPIQVLLLSIASLASLSARLFSPRGMWIISWEGNNFNNPWTFPASFRRWGCLILYWPISCRTMSWESE